MGDALLEPPLKFDPEKFKKSLSMSIEAGVDLVIAEANGELEPEFHGGQTHVVSADLNRQLQYAKALMLEAVKHARVTKGEMAVRRRHLKSVK